MSSLDQKLFIRMFAKNVHTFVSAYKYFLNNSEARDENPVKHVQEVMMKAMAAEKLVVGLHLHGKLTNVDELINISVAAVRTTEFSINVRSILAPIIFAYLMRRPYLTVNKTTGEITVDGDKVDPDLVQHAKENVSAEDATLFDDGHRRDLARITETITCDQLLGRDVNLLSFHEQY